MCDKICVLGAPLLCHPISFLHSTIVFLSVFCRIVRDDTAAVILFGEGESSSNSA